MRTLLIVTFHFPPSAASGSFRLLGLARHLPACGWRTAVVAPPSMPYEPVDEKLARQIPPESAVYPVPYPQGKRTLRWLMPFGVWAPSALKACAEAIDVERPDAVLTSSPPHMIHLIGRLLQRRHGLPWVADYRDPWIHGLGKPRPRTMTARWEAFRERFVLRAADRFVVNTPRARDALSNDVPGIADKIAVITNGFDPEVFDDVPAAERRPGAIAIVHTGELYCGRDPRPLFDALSGLRLAVGQKLDVEFLGQSSHRQIDWNNELESRGLKNQVRFTGQAPYAQALARMKAADILLLLDTPGRHVGIPAKLFEYFGARRPILALSEPGGDVAWALRQSGVCHRIAPPTDVGQIRQALEELINETLTSAGEETAVEEFTRARMAAKLADVLNELVDCSNRVVNPAPTRRVSEGVSG